MTGGAAETAAGQPRLVGIVRHPVKSLGYETLDTVQVGPGAGLPLDRVWAVEHEAAGPPSLSGDWRPKRAFVRGAAAQTLMAVRCRCTDGGTVVLSHPDRPDLVADLATEQGSAALLDWVAPLWPGNRPAPARIVRASAHFADNPEPFVAVVNLASQRALERVLGQPLSAHRWRANLWLDGLAPWTEFDLVGRQIRLGTAVLRVVARITRCEATAGNPETGRRDADTLGALERGWSHTDFGVFALVTAGGTLRTGQIVEMDA